MARYQYRLLRYAPNQVSGEFYNVAVLLYDDQGRVVDARFTPDFRRMRCHPLASVRDLEKMRDEFEDRRLLGEDFSGYLARLTENLSNTLQLSETRAVFAVDPEIEMQRLVERYVATPPAPDEDPEARPARLGGRRLVRLRLTDAFERQGLLRNGRGLRKDAQVRYGATGLSFSFDFQYLRPTNEERFIHALGLRSAEAEAARLSFVLQQYRALSERDAGLTVVAEDALGADVRGLLAHQGIGMLGLSEIDGYAASVKAELGV